MTTPDQMTYIRERVDEVANKLDALLHERRRDQLECDPVDIKTAARLLDRAPWTIRSYAREGRINATRLQNGQFRVALAEIKRFKEEGPLPNSH